MDKVEILKHCRENLYSAVISDSLDSMGYHHQAADPGIMPLDDKMTISGFVRVGLYMPIFHDDAQTDVYGEEIRLVDSLEKGDVPVLVCHSKRIAPWGELLSTRAEYLGAAGCITDGCVRDVKRIREMNYPVFSMGRSPVDTKYRGKMLWYDVPAEFAGVRINSGDLVIADMDGVVFVPEKIIVPIVEKSLEKVHAETTVRQELSCGASLGEVFARHGIL
jgi:4-hydroxy-4-methyl-2-oxoglutarate aldolase